MEFFLGTTKDGKFNGFGIRFFDSVILGASSEVKSQKKTL